MSIKKGIIGTGFLALVLFGGIGCSLGSGNNHINSGMELVSALDYDGALASFEAAGEAFEDRRLLHRGRGLSYMGKTEYEAAVEAFQTALSYSDGIPDRIDYDINYYMAVCFYKSGQKDQAISIYNAILALQDNDKDAYYLRGAILAEQGKLEEARKDFDQALLLESNGYDRLIEIYLVLEDNGYKEIGLEYLEAAMDTEISKMADYEKGRVSYYLGDYENAKAYLEKARDTGYQAVLFLGRTHEMLNEYNYAISVYRSFLDEGNESPQIYNQLGLCLLNQKEYAEALSAFQAGMAIEDNEIMQTLRYHEIVAYENLRDFEMAKVLMAGYIKDYPDDERAGREYIFLESR